MISTKQHRQAEVPCGKKRDKDEANKYNKTKQIIKEKKIYITLKTQQNKTKQIIRKENINHIKIKEK